MNRACRIRVHGVVQGVGFRPFVFRLAAENTLGGWVANGTEGVEIFLEGANENVERFVNTLRAAPPAAARIASIEVQSSSPVGATDFTIRRSEPVGIVAARISPDLPVCEACLRELQDESDPRFAYPYINCTECGPRYSVILKLPYDRANTTLRDWPLDGLCRGQYEDPADRRFHAEPVACAGCGPNYFLKQGEETVRGSAASVRKAAELLCAGCILAIKGIGGYHVACDARNSAAVESLRERKFRKEKPFAVMARDLATADAIAVIDKESRKLLTSAARPITLVPGKEELAGVAPGTRELGVMLPYTPLHYLLFAAGAPEVLVMTSGNRSSEPIAYEDDDAERRLADIVDGFLIGERPIARRVDDSVARAGVCGPTILRRSRGYAPGLVATLPTDQPILALGADLKNAVALVIKGQAFVSQHIGDLDQHQSLTAFEQTVGDLLSMYALSVDQVLVACDAHPQYRSTQYASRLAAGQRILVQHHRAHVASVLAERGEWDQAVLGISLDGTGYGDDGSIWGGEIFHGSVSEGFARVAHLRPALLAGGDAAAEHPVQAAAGFLQQVEELPDLAAAPFCFPERYRQARQLARSGLRCIATTSMGRLFDTVAALLGFTRAVSFEGQAAIFVEQLAAQTTSTAGYRFIFSGGQLDFRPVLREIVEDRIRGRDVREIARAFHAGLASGLADAVGLLAEAKGTRTVAASGGVFQNELLLNMLQDALRGKHMQLWINHQVPPNDGGISLGQAAIAVFSGKLSSELPAQAVPVGVV